MLKLEALTLFIMEFTMVMGKSKKILREIYMNATIFQACISKHSIRNVILKEISEISAFCINY